ncbi:MAG: hypothetical protein KA278_02255 [Flavobacterium sp.]|nr:hypothetical protein [Flavobacterium sp.]
MIEFNNIKDESFIVDSTLNDSGGYDFILKNGTWLGDVLEFLPNGIIHKGVTGIGATTMELNCDRNSIIIQPLKVTVEQKSLGIYKHEIFSYSKKSSSSLYNDLNQYLDDASIEFKKIILVIDRLEDLIFDLGESVVDYFFLFDEIDYMQGSSSYRKKMEDGLDLGIALDNFALVSATHIGFSDPELKKLKTYNFRYQEIEYKQIQTFYLSNPGTEKHKKEKITLNQLFSCICHMLAESNSKILVAVNNVKLISELSDALIKNEKINKESITLLISDNNLKNNTLIKKYSGLQIENNQLPTRLNFITSAYFNGYDLQEQDLCLMIYSSPNYHSNLISANEIKQIYGRNRLKNGTTNFFLFTHDLLKSDLKDAELLLSSEEDWIRRGEISVEIQNCIDKHLHKLKTTNKNNDYFTKYFKQQTETLELNLSRSKIIFNKENFLQAFHNEMYKKTENSISYLQIDYLRYYYNYLNLMYVMPEWEAEIEVKNEIVNETFYSTISSRLTELLLGFGFKEVENKTEWINLVFKPENATHQIEIEEAFYEVEAAMKTITTEKIKFSQLQQKIYDVIVASKKMYSKKSIKNTILACKSKNQLNLLFEFVRYGDFNKTNKCILLKGKLKENTLYTIQELVDIASNVVDEKNKKSKMSTNGTLELIRLVFNTELVHKKGSKTGEKMYKLKKHNPFATLSKTKRKRVQG